MSQEVYKMYKNALNESILYKFQKKALDNSKPDYFYALDTGTGKTITSIHHYMKYSEGEPLLIVAPPQKIKERGWDRDIAFIEKQYNVKIRYETLSYGVIAKHYRHYENFFIIFDEAHYIKNATSQRGKAAYKLTQKSSHFVLLTATPMSNGWEDSYNYFIMFGYFHNKKHMNDEHAIWGERYLGTRSFKVVTGWRNESLLYHYFNEFTVSISKDEALDLPPIVFKDVHFDKSTEYKKIEQHRVLDDEVFDTLPKLMHGLRFYANQEDKQKYTEMLFEGTSENIVIFYQYKSELTKLKEICQSKNKKIYEVNGSQSQIPKKETWALLKNTVTLVQYQSGSAGIELQYANIVVFYTPTYSFQDYSQALGRAYRNGQTKKVTVYRFITEKTIERSVWEALKNKKDFNEKIYLDTKLGE